MPGGSLPCGPLWRPSVRARTVSTERPVANCVKHPGDGDHCTPLAGSAARLLRPGPALMLEANRLLGLSPRVFPLNDPDSQDPRKEQFCPPLLHSRLYVPVPQSWKSSSQAFPSLRDQAGNASDFCYPGNQCGLPSPEVLCAPRAAHDAVLAAQLSCAPR